MSRPLSKIEDLKNPRVIRKSTVTGVQLDIPTPSNKEVKKWKPLVDMCLEAISKNIRKDNIERKEKINITFNKITDRPKWFPVGRIVEGDSSGKVVLQFNAEGVLLALWTRKLAPYTPSQWYAMLQPVNSMLRNIEKPFDIDQYMLHNDVYQMIDDNEKEN